MLILKYFKHIDNESLSMLPNPEGPLSASMSSKTIATANKNARGHADVLSKLLIVSNHREHYLTLTPPF